MSKDKEINPFDKYHYSITSSDNGSMSTKKIEEIITDDKTILYGGEAFVDKEYNKDDMMTAYQHGKTIGIHETELSERKRILKEVEKLRRKLPHNLPEDLEKTKNNELSEATIRNGIKQLENNAVFESVTHYNQALADVKKIVRRK